MISTAPRPSKPDQPISRTVRFGASAVVIDPQAYTMQPRPNARLRPTISPTLPPVIISDAITSVYIVIAVWIPVTVVSRSLATVAIAVFITVVSRAITNWPAPSVNRTTPVAPAARPAFFVIVASLSRPVRLPLLPSEAMPEAHRGGNGIATVDARSVVADTPVGDEIGPARLTGQQPRAAALACPRH